jgi:hypothetical protein
LILRIRHHRFCGITRLGVSGFGDVIGCTSGFGSSLASYKREAPAAIHAAIKLPRAAH